MSEDYRGSSFVGYRCPNPGPPTLSCPPQRAEARARGGGYRAAGLHQPFVDRRRAVRRDWTAPASPHGRIHDCRVHGHVPLWPGIRAWAGDLILSVIPKPSAAVKYSLIASAGLVLILGGSGIWLRRRALANSDATKSLRKSHGSSAAIGAGIAGLELLTAFPYFAAIAMIVGSASPTLQRCRCSRCIASCIRSR